MPRHSHGHKDISSGIHTDVYTNSQHASTPHARMQACMHKTHKIHQLHKSPASTQHTQACSARAPTTPAHMAHGMHTTQTCTASSSVLSFKRSNPWKDSHARKTGIQENARPDELLAFLRNKGNVRVAMLLALLPPPCMCIHAEGKIPRAHRSAQEHGRYTGTYP